MKPMSSIARRVRRRGMRSKKKGIKHAEVDSTWRRRPLDVVGVTAVVCCGKSFDVSWWWVLDLRRAFKSHSSIWASFAVGLAVRSSVIWPMTSRLERVLRHAVLLFSWWRICCWWWLLLLGWRIIFVLLFQLDKNKWKVLHFQCAWNFQGMCYHSCIHKSQFVSSSGFTRPIKLFIAFLDTW